jgi:hypothetical protein
LIYNNSVKRNTKEIRNMTQKEINAAIEASLNAYGRNATLEALNKMYHNGQITIEQCMNALDTINR